MKILERLLNLISPSRRALSASLTQPNELKAQIDLVRARAYQRITGRRLTTVEAGSVSDIASLDSLKTNLSPRKRLARRGI